MMVRINPRLKVREVRFDRYCARPGDEINARREVVEAHLGWRIAGRRVLIPLPK